MRLKEIEALPTGLPLNPQERAREEGNTDGEEKKDEPDLL